MSIAIIAGQSVVLVLSIVICRNQLAILHRLSGVERRLALVEVALDEEFPL